MTATRDDAFRALQPVVARIRERFRTPPDFKRLTPAEQLVFRVVVVFDAEMQNGGIDQFLRNQSGDSARQVMADLERIGAVRALNVLGTAARWFPGATIPTDTDLRFDALVAAERKDREAFGLLGEALSRAYLKATAELYRKLLKFVKDQRSEFP